VGGEQHVEIPRRVHDASAAAYVEFAGTELSDATEDDVDRSMLTAFAQLARRVDATGTVADLGCGPGRAAAHVAAHLPDVVGVDLSLGLLQRAAEAHPHVPFAQGRLDQLPFADDVLSGAVCWYSIIYTPPPLLAPILAELARVTVVGGVVLLAFPAGSGAPVVRRDAHGTAMTLTSYLHDVDDLLARLQAAGFDVHARAVREPSRPHERARQAFVIARRSAPPGPAPRGGG
jgi:SAM-dependent methyltransferase